MKNLIPVIAIFAIFYLFKKPTRSKYGTEIFYDNMGGGQYFNPNTGRNESL